MKIICDWKNCKNVGSYKAPIEKIIVEIIDFCALNILRYLINLGIISKI